MARRGSTTTPEATVVVTSAEAWFGPEPAAITLAATPDWPVPADTREPAAAFEERINVALAGGPVAPEPTPEPAPVAEPDAEPSV